MASVEIDTQALVMAAVANVFAQADPKALAEAMATTVLEKTGGYGSKTTVLEEIVATEVRRIAREAVAEILNDYRDILKAAILAEHGDTLAELAVRLVGEKLR